MPKSIEEYIEQLRAMNKELCEMSTHTPGDLASAVHIPIEGLLVALDTKCEALLGTWIACFAMFASQGESGREFLRATAEALVRDEKAMLQHKVSLLIVKD